MRGIYIIVKWEISRIYSNWRRAVATFVVPAEVMMIALCIFPYLINYMLTGSISEKPVTIINAPDTFIEHIEQTEGTTVYTYNLMSEEEFTELWDSGEVIKQLKSGSLFVMFNSNTHSAYVGCNGNSSIAVSKAESFIEVVMDPYNESLAAQGQIVYSMDDFNPVTKLLDYRSGANFG